MVHYSGHALVGSLARLEGAIFSIFLGILGTRKGSFFCAR